MTEVKMVQVGITTRCNSNCHFCFREELKRAGRTEGNSDFPSEGIQKIIDQGIRDIHLCGNRGEAIFHPEIEKIIDMIKGCGSRFEMNTNGSRFDETWWRNLGKRMTEGDQVIFAVDGLKDTHEYYRNTPWIKVINNMKAFIEGGGKAIWQLILFKHNEKQVDFIKKISKTMGCAETWIINSRFYNDKYKKPTVDYNKTKEDILLEENQKMQINCRFYRGRRVYIGVDGSVWPCCFMRCHFGFKERAYPNNPVTAAFKEQEEFNNVLNTPLNDIVNNSKMFTRIFDNMYNDSVPYNGEYTGISFEEDLERPIMFKNPNKECLVRHPRYMVNFACQLYCNTKIEGGNRRHIKNV